MPLKDTEIRAIRATDRPVRKADGKGLYVEVFGGGRCTKLFLPGNGDRFASRKAWKLHYRSQRVAWHDKPFERLNRLQRKLGCREGYEEWIFRPKGMWHRTFAKHQAEFDRINRQCDYVWAGMMARLGVIRDRL